MRKKLLFIAMLAGCIQFSAMSQIAPKGYELQEIVRINEVYRLIPYLSFTARFTYADSVTTDSLLEEMNATYQLHDGRFRYVIDSTEIIQGPNYNVAVYHDQQIINVSKPALYPNVMQVSLLMDSLYRRLHIDSMHVALVTDTMRVLTINFKRGETYSGYEMAYDPITYLLKYVKYYMHDVPEDTDTGRSGTSLIKVAFNHYDLSVIDDAYFRESKFIYKDGNTFYAQATYSTYEVNAIEN